MIILRENSCPHTTRVTESHNCCKPRAMSFQYWALGTHLKITKDTAIAENVGLASIREKKFMSGVGDQIRTEFNQRKSKRSRSMNTRGAIDSPHQYDYPDVF